MKKSTSFVPSSTCLAIALFAVSAAAQVKTADVLVPATYDTFVPPSAGGTYTDTAFGTSIKRVSDAARTRNADQGGYLTWIANEYSTINAFNSDNSRFILLHQSYFGLYDQAGYFLYDLPLEVNSSSEPRWSTTNPDTLYYHVRNELRSYSVASGGIQVVQTFFEYQHIGSRGEADISADGNNFVFVGDDRFVFVYEVSTAKKYPVLDTAGRAFDSVYVTPDNHVTITWSAAGTARYSGIELFDSDMRFLRQVAHVGGHMDLTRDNNGDELLVWTNSNDPQPLPNCNNGIVKIRLSDARQTCLLQLAWSLAVHISAANQDGFVYVDTEAPGNPQPGGSGWVPYTNEVLQVALDGSATARLAHHRSRPWDSYNWQPKLSISRDGTRLLYTSNYNLPGNTGIAPTYSDTYLIEMGGAVAPVLPPAPPSAPTPPTPPVPPAAPVVVRHEQSDPAVQSLGTWFPNNATVHSGGSAKLAMDQGSEVRFTFTGTAVYWIGYRDSWSGNADVYLDGAFRTTVSTYSAAAQAQAVLFRATGLSAGPHILRIAVRRGRSRRAAWVWVDAFDVTTTPPPTQMAPAPVPSPAAASPVTIEQSDSRITYSGGVWHNNSMAAHSGNSAIMSMDPNARAQLAFTGTAIRWTGYRDEWSGLARVFIDGVLQATVDTYSAPARAQSTLFEAGGLAAGPHTLIIEAVGNHSASSQGSWVWVDAFTVTP